MFGTSVKKKKYKNILGFMGDLEVLETIRTLLQFPKTHRSVVCLLVRESWKSILYMILNKAYNQQK